MRKLFLKKILLLSAIILYASITNIIAQVKPSSITSLSRISTIDKKWQQGGIFEGKTPQQEILSARTEYTKKFNRNDGKIDIIFGGPFHYADKNGAWQDIDLNIKPINNPIFKYGNEENKFISRFAENLNDGVKMNYKNNSIAFGINPKIYSENWIPSTATPNVLLKGNIISYKNIYDNIDLEYELTDEAILHRMQFNNKNVFTGLTSQQFINVEETIQLPPNSKLKDEDGVINTNRTTKGNIFIVVNEDTIYTIIAAHIWDATYKGNILDFGRNDDIDGVRDVKTSISFLPGNSIKFIALLPTNWLLAPDRMYPITYDPIVYVGNASSFSSNYRYPFNTCRLQRISQILFLKSDLNVGGINSSGVITDIAFLQNSNNPMINNNIVLQMQEVAWNGMTTSTLTASASGWTNCYGPSNQNYTTGGSNVWQTLPLTNQFSYTNTNNLLVQVKFNNCGLTATSCPLQNTSNTGHAPGGQWGYLNASYYGHRWAYSDNCNAPPSPTVSGGGIEDNPGYGNYIPATRITINTTTCTPVSNGTIQPQTQTVAAGNTATFSTSVNGTPPFSYFWYKNGILITNTLNSSSTTNSFTTPTLVYPTDNGNTYYCLVINCNNQNQVQSNTAVLTVNGSSCIPPATPTGLQQTSSTTNSISLSWNASVNAQSYIIRDCNTGATYNTTGTTTTISGLTSGNYSFQIIAVGTGCNSAASNCVSCSTSNSGCIPPATPTGLQQTSSTTNSISLSWNASVNAQSYIIRDCNTGTTYNSTGTTTTISGLTSGNYSFQIIAVGAGCNSAASNCVSCSTLNSGCTPPTTPTGLQQTSSTTNSISLSWNASLNAQSYIIKNCNTGATYNATGNSTTISGLTSGTNYSFQIIAVGSNCNSAPSSCVACSTTSIPSSITINNNNSVIPPWQRENDDLVGSINANYSNMPTGANIQLDIYVNGIFAGTATGTTWATTSSSGTHEFDFNIKASSLTPKPKKGDQVGYQLINNTSGAHDDATQQTNIIEGQWVNKNIVYYNVVGNNLKIPLEYFPNTNSVTISFTRDDLTGQVGPSIIHISGSYLDLEDNIIQNGFLSQTNNLKYITLDNLNSYLQNVSPGDFTYNITYNGTSFQEQGKIDLTKIGRLNASDPNSNHIIVCIGGIFNTTEKDFDALNGDPNSADLNSGLTFSIASYITNNIDNFTTNNFSCNTWYIAQGNTNSIKRNAYDLGIALDSIKAHCHFTGSNDEIDLITHSKGGLDTRALLGSNNSTAQFLAQSLSGNSFNFQTSDLSPYIKKVVFLDVPHYGASIEFQNIQHNSPAKEDLKPGSDILNYLNGGSVAIPVNIKPLNLTGFYNDFIQNDFAVWMFESENPYLQQPYIQIYQNAPGFLGILHIKISSNQVLSNDGKCTTPIYKNIDKIKDFINDQTVLSCVRGGIFNLSFSTYGSILSNAKIYIKLSSDNNYNLIGTTNENGDLNISRLGNFSINDSFKIKAPGYETLVLAVDAKILNSGKIEVSMLKSNVPINKIKYASLKLVNQNPITSNSAIDIEETGQNILSFQINSPLNQDSIFVPLTLSNNNFTAQLDTGYNRIMVKFIGTDTVILSKEVYYLPDSLMRLNTYNVSITTDPVYIGTRLYVNDQFIKQINAFDETIPVLMGRNTFKFTKFGYVDSLVTVDSAATIKSSLQLFPYSYSSTTDSSIINFQNMLNPQYWKNITVKNNGSTNNIQISLKQYDDAFPNMGLIPQCRKFVFRNLTSNSNVKLRTAIALDQIDTPDSADVYLLTFKNGQYKKYRANQANVSEYDPEVQKVAFDSINLGANQAEEIVLMKKLAPIMKFHGADTIYSGQPNIIPLSNYVADPDSIKDDIAIAITNVSAPSSDVQFTINGGVITVIAGNDFTGDVTFTLSATHDFITVNKTFILKVIPTSVQFPNAFTPNNDGLNDVFRPKVYGHVVKYHLLIYNRNGEKVFETFDYNKGWDGRVNGTEQQTTVFVWALTYQLEGKAQENKRGIITLIR
jgi:gliding motility-associated-like protein